jgi:hypothetical protein
MQQSSQTGHPAMISTRLPAAGVPHRPLGVDEASAASTAAWGRSSGACRRLSHRRSTRPPRDRAGRADARPGRTRRMRQGIGMHPEPARRVLVSPPPSAASGTSCSSARLPFVPSALAASRLNSRPVTIRPPSVLGRDDAPPAFNSSRRWQSRSVSLPAWYLTSTCACSCGTNRAPQAGRYGSLRVRIPREQRDQTLHRGRRPRTAPCAPPP